eukprot:Tbor_TRINITY_DN2047_c0_g1::TRINITY_DN2047_c0_g1_i1::g.12120::m.12120
MALLEAQKGLTNLVPFTSDCGAIFERYYWSQDDDEVVVTATLPHGTTSKQVTVDICTNHLKCGIKGQPLILDGPLFMPIKAEESLYTIENKGDVKVLVITLCKTNMKYEEWWPHVCTNEPQADLKTLIPPSKHVKDMDAGAQSAISKMMFDQEQKKKGMPTSDEMKIRDLMNSPMGQ